MHYFLYTFISVWALSAISYAASDQAALREKKKECQSAIIEKTSFYRMKVGKLRAEHKTSREKGFRSNSEYAGLREQKKNIQKSIDESGMSAEKKNQLKQTDEQIKQLRSQLKDSQETAAVKDEINTIKQAMEDVRTEEMASNPACVEGYEKPPGEK